MNEKGMLQICIPFIMAVVVIAIFYGLYLVVLGIGFFFYEILDLDWFIFLDEICCFLDIFSGDYTGSIVVAIILWLILTIYFEIQSTED